ncbi:MAG: glutamate-1-semialdehyde 2,1-aminomutase [Candidatus Omnitrophica bacterium]|nr:glutamate-1-semialdehyde 2,1-aminomutase [Candidatus Omnitrophota bacterium]
MKRAKSAKLFKEAAKYLVGGVNSPVRSFKGVDTGIIFAERARGPHLWDVDGNKYVDYIMSWGVHIFGHGYGPIVEAAVKSIKNGASFGLATKNEIELAKEIQHYYNTISKVRLVTSGTEACMTAVRLARAFTGRSKVIKFDGCYHGHFDGLLVKSGSGNLTFGIPSGKGITASYSRDTISVPFNDINIFSETVRRNRGDIACVIVEPVPCNTGVILPEEGFLRRLAAIAKRENIVLVFDEVITGFRLSSGGAQKLFGIKPDLTCLGKIIGGGFPVGAVGGRSDIMELLAPEGPVYQAGTLSGNPVSVAAGLAALRCLKEDKNLYAGLEKKTGELVAAMRKAAFAEGIPLTINTIGSVFSVFFTDKSVGSLADALGSDKEKYKKLFSGLCEEGVLFPPSAFEACFMSRAHDGAALERTIKGFRKALRKING